MIFGGDDGDFLVVSRLIWLKRSSMVQHFCLRPAKEITAKMRPRFNRAETDALVILKNLRDVFCSRANQRKAKVAADAESQAGKSRKLVPRNRSRLIITILCLNSPKFRSVCFGNKVNAFVRLWKI